MATTKKPVQKKTPEKAVKKPVAKTKPIKPAAKKVQPKKAETPMVKLVVDRMPLPKGGKVFVKSAKRPMAKKPSKAKKAK